MKRLLQLLLISLFPVITISQTLEEKQAITKDYNKDKLEEIASSFQLRAELDKAEALELAKQNGWPVRYEEDGKYMELMKVSKEGTPMYYTTFNVNAAKSTRANTMHNNGILGLNVEGQNMEAHVWDAGLARSAHQEYDGIGGSNRFSIGDGTTGLHWHSAHVTGTIIASGYVASAKGMAPQANAIGYDWSQDASEATIASLDGMLLSNHSYGWTASSLTDWMFGAYMGDSKAWDIIMYNAPYYLMVVAAGNDGNDNYSNGDPLDGNSYYDKLSGFKTSKNNLVVANADDANIDANGNLISVIINSSSSEGPCDDYRIKPDITGNGSNVYSTLDNSDSHYGNLTGTSMASPNVTGTLLLLQQHYNNLHYGFMRAATLKGLALHTADDAGPSGPDVVYGWGLLNAKEAAYTISTNSVESTISELTLNNGESYSINVDSDGIDDLIVSISWTDPAGEVTGIANDNTPVLVNDLDVRVTKGGSTYYPYRLTSITTNGIGDNIVDPYEKIIIGGALGTYTITVTHKGSLSGGDQNYSLIVTGKASVSTAPLADFAADDITPSLGQTVNFSDLSTNIPTSWSWSFSPNTVSYVGGTNSTSQYPQVSFDAIGLYTATLTATNDMGNDTEVKTDYINVSLSSQGTYTFGDISTDYSFQSLPGSSSCPGSLIVNIPAGVTITSVDVEYDMTASNSEYAWISEQRSQLRCVSAGGTDEGTLYPGIGNAPGTLSYNRTGLTIANGVTGGGNINFQLHAGRTWGGSGCNTTYNKVDNNTWSVRVYYTLPIGPSNDNCSGATAINEVTDLPFDTSPATASGVNLSCVSGAQIDLWYAYTATITGNATFDLCGSGYNTGLGIWSACGGAELACNDDDGPACSGTTSSITMSVISGTTYYVQVCGYNGAIGVGDLTIQVYVPVPGLWTGNTSTDWGLTSNWDDGNIPLAGTNVIIPATPTGGNFPETNSGSGAECNNLTIETGAHLEIPVDNTLTVIGTLINNSGTEGLIVKSDANGTGSLIEGNGVYATVERYYTGGQWHLISSPVVDETANTFFGLFLQVHNEVTNAYSDVINETMVLEPGQGYALWNASSATTTYTGYLNLTATRALTRTATGFGNGWNLVGNPYSSSIDWDAANGWTKTNVDATTYCFDGVGTGNWATWNGITGLNGGSQYIASGQGFFVAVNDAQTTGSLSFTNDVRVHDNTIFFKDEPADIVKLKVSGNNYADEAAVYFRDEATLGYDSQMDAHQLPGFNNLAPYIYSTDNEGMAINVLPQVASVPMNVKVGIETGTYSIETVSNGEFSELYLEDLATGTITNLNTDSYTFDYIPGIESRFELHFGALGVDDIGNDLYNIYSFNKDVYVAVPENTSGTITIYDMMGKEIAKETISSSVNIITLEKSAYYVVKVLSNENIVTKKVFIK